MNVYEQIASLIKQQETDRKDEYGDPIFTEIKRTVFVEEKSVGMREFYSAHTAGMKPEIVLELADYLDYDDETKVEYNGKRYDVLRTYRKGVELEIVLHGGVRVEHT